MADMAQMAGSGNLETLTELCKAEIEGLPKLQSRTMDHVREAYLKGDISRDLYSQIMMGYIQDQADFRGVLKEVAKDKYIDPGTGLLNKHSYRIVARQVGKGDALILVDIDRFKDLNDTYGHQKGDLALRYVADSISDVVRKTDVVIRYGGEEIVVFMKDCDKPGACSVAEKISESVSTINFSKLARLIPGIEKLTVSQGVVLVKEGDSYSDVFDLGDSRLYQAKAEGRDRYISEGPGISREAKN